MAGESLPVYGDGKNIRDWLYVEDHAKALSLVLERGIVGETYNVGVVTSVTICTSSNEFATFSTRSARIPTALTETS